MRRGREAFDQGELLLCLSNSTYNVFNRAAYTANNKYSYCRESRHIKKLAFLQSLILITIHKLGDEYGGNVLSYFS